MSCRGGARTALPAPHHASVSCKRAVVSQEGRFTNRPYTKPVAQAVRFGVVICTNPLDQCVGIYFARLFACRLAC